MKYQKIPIFILIIHCHAVVAQDVKAKTDSSAIYKAEDVNIIPSTLVGEKEFQIYFQKNFKSSNSEKMPDLTSLHFTFIIELNGNLTNFQGLDEMNLPDRTRFINVLQNSRQWIPGTRNNSLIRTQFTLPFSLIIKKNNAPNSASNQPFGGKKKEKKRNLFHYQN